ncbi:MAG: MoaD/ThiS family protein [Candidatus Heimdallarchaeota archaeon]|nr:MAG: MoaD/ThiS family protein [Candidatus Heimdallarchaeota archaeon]
MTKLRIQLFGQLGSNLGSDIELEFRKKEPTLREVIKILIKKDPQLKPLLRGNNLKRGIILLVNGHIVDRSEWGLDKNLSTQDSVIIDQLGFLPIVGGGNFSENRRFLS